jgi:hypothetical protein
LEVGTEGGFKLDLRQDSDPGKWRFKGAVRTETYQCHIANNCGTYLQWNFIQSQRSIKFCHLYVNGWSCRTTSYVKLARLRKPKVVYFSQNM